MPRANPTTASSAPSVQEHRCLRGLSGLRRRTGARAEDPRQDRLQTNGALRQRVIAAVTPCQGHLREAGRSRRPSCPENNTADYYPLRSLTGLNITSTPAEALGIQPRRFDLALFLSTKYAAASRRRLSSLLQGLVHNRFSLVEPLLLRLIRRLDQRRVRQGSAAANQGSERRTQWRRREHSPHASPERQRLSQDPNARHWRECAMAGDRKSHIKAQPSSPRQPDDAARQ